MINLRDMYKRERDEARAELQRANEEIKRLTQVNESHCRMWNEAEDDLKRTCGFLELAFFRLNYVRSKQGLMIQTGKIREC